MPVKRTFIPFFAAAMLSFCPVNAFSAGFDELKIAGKEQIQPEKDVNIIKMTDDLYIKLKENFTFDNADKKLNKTWNLVKNIVPKEKFKQIKKEQSIWISEKRDKVANEYLKSMDLANAFTRATNDRIHELTKFISENPSNKKYIYKEKSYSGDMTIKVNNGIISASINTVNSNGSGVCGFEGNLLDLDKDGWFESEEQDDGISVLFMKDRVELLDVKQTLCGVSGNMSGIYRVHK